MTDMQVQSNSNITVDNIFLTLHNHVLDRVLLGNMESSRQPGADNYQRSPIYIYSSCVFYMSMCSCNELAYNGKDKVEVGNFFRTRVKFRN